MNYTTKITTFRQEFKALGDHLESNGIDLTWEGNEPVLDTIPYIAVKDAHVHDRFEKLCYFSIEQVIKCIAMIIVCICLNIALITGIGIGWIL